jgi:hypothetical protein
MPQLPRLRFGLMNYTKLKDAQAASLREPVRTDSDENIVSSAKERQLTEFRNPRKRQRTRFRVVLNGRSRRAALLGVRGCQQVGKEFAGRFLLC